MQNQLTKNVQKFTTEIVAESFAGAQSFTQSFDTYKFPIYGSADANSLTSFVVLFNFCFQQGASLSVLPLVLSISNNPATNYDKLNLRFSQSGSLSGDIQIVANDQDFSSYIMYFSSTNTDVQSIEISLQKTDYPDGNVKYNANFNGPVKYIPSPFGTQNNAQQILATITPTVSVLTYKQKNYLSFIGSVVGIFPLFMLIGNKLSAKIDGCKKSGKEDEIAMEERGVLNTN